MLSVKAFWIFSALFLCGEYEGVAAQSTGTLGELSPAMLPAVMICACAW